MKNIQYICMLLLLGGLFTACEDVIQLELKNTEPRIVIEATINNNTEEVTVIVTETNDFYNNNAPTIIENAEITLSDDAGNSTDIPFGIHGSYVLENYSATAGDEYEIVVKIGNEEYAATTIAPYLVPLVGVDSSLVIPPFSPDAAYYQTLLRWVDTPDQTNYYRIRGYLNDSIMVGPYAFYNDRGLDGELFIRPLMEIISPGDKMEFQLINVDRETHDYFLQIAAVQSQGFGSSAPFNPKGNFNNNALGFFGINHTSSQVIQF